MKKDIIKSVLIMFVLLGSVGSVNAQPNLALEYQKQFAKSMEKLTRAIFKLDKNSGKKFYEEMILCGAYSQVSLAYLQKLGYTTDSIAKEVKDLYGIQTQVMFASGILIPNILKKGEVGVDYQALLRADVQKKTGKLITDGNGGSRRIKKDFYQKLKSKYGDVCKVIADDVSVRAEYWQNSPKLKNPKKLTKSIPEKSAPKKSVADILSILKNKSATDKKTAEKNKKELTFSNGAKYFGTVKGGKANGGSPYGGGTLIFPNGDRYVGGFKNNKFHGKGTYTYANGDKWVLENESFGGSNRLKSKHSNPFGKYIDGKKEGEFVFIYAKEKNLGDLKIKKAKHRFRGDKKIYSDVYGYSIGCKSGGEDHNLSSGNREFNGGVVGEYVNGDNYSGCIDQRGRPHGYGALTTANEKKQSGVFKSGKILSEKVVAKNKAYLTKKSHDDAERRYKKEADKAESDSFNPIVGAIIGIGLDMVLNKDSNSQPVNITSAMAQLRQHFFESTGYFLQSQEHLLRAYGKDQEAQMVVEAMKYAKNSKNSEADRMKNTIKVTTSSSKIIESSIGGKSANLSSESRVYYANSLSPAVRGVASTIKILPAVKIVVQAIKQDPQGTLLSVGFEMIGILTQLPGYFSGMTTTMKLVLTGANANKIEGAENLESSLGEL